MAILNNSVAQLPAPLQVFLTRLEGLTEQLGQRPGFGLMQINCAIRLLLHERQSRRALEMVRTAAALCSDMCPSAECLSRTGELARATRDNYIKLLHLLPWPLFILRGTIEESLYAWDDLAEDCSVGSDPEIRETILKIAERV